MLVEMLAWCGAALSCLLCVPQAVRTLRAERLDGVSATTYWIVLANAAVWTAWSLLTGELATGAPALVTAPTAMVILSRLAAARHDHLSPASIPVQGGPSGMVRRGPASCRPSPPLSEDERPAA